MKIELYPKNMLEALWKEDKKVVFKPCRADTQMPPLWKSAGQPASHQSIKPSC